MPMRSRLVDDEVTFETRSLRSNTRVEQEEGIMGIIMIKCPSTGHAVSTGIEMSGLDRLPSVIATMVCSACGRVHEWTKADAWLAEGGEYYRQLATKRGANRSINGSGRPVLERVQQE
jgi:hypothetical protein